MSEAINIVIADAHPLFRRGLAMACRSARSVQVIAEVGCAEETYDTVSRVQPDVLLMDFVDNGGIEVARAIKAALLPVKVVMLTASEDDEYVTEAIAAGAKGYILKGVTALDLIRAIECVHAGGSYITPELAMRMVMQAQAQRSDPAPATWSREELRILAHLTAGQTNDEIAAHIGLNIRVTKRCVTKLFRKLGVRNRVEAVIAAQKLKLKPAI